MLIPAIIKKTEILDAFKQFYYTDDMLYETGSLDNWTPNIQDEPASGVYQFAIVNSNNDLIGYLDYHIDWYNSCANRFGLFSFDRGNPIVGKDLYDELNKLLNIYKLHRIEWRMVGGNPVERGYDKICERFNGTKHILRDAIKDKFGKYHDDIIYEIIND